MSWWKEIPQNSNLTLHRFLSFSQFLFIKKKKRISLFGRLVLPYVSLLTLATDTGITFPQSLAHFGRSLPCIVLFKMHLYSYFFDIYRLFLFLVGVGGWGMIVSQFCIVLDRVKAFHILLQSSRRASHSSGLPQSHVI